MPRKSNGAMRRAIRPAVANAQRQSEKDRRRTRRNAAASHKPTTKN